MWRRWTFSSTIPCWMRRGRRAAPPLRAAPRRGRQRAGRPAIPGSAPCRRRRSRPRPRPAPTPRRHEIGPDGEQRADGHVAAVAAAGDRHPARIEDAATGELVEGGELVVELDAAEGVVEGGLEGDAPIECAPVVDDDHRAAELGDELAPQRDGQLPAVRDLLGVRPAVDPEHRRRGSGAGRVDRAPRGARWPRPRLSPWSAPAPAGRGRRARRRFVEDLLPALAPHRTTRGGETRLDERSIQLAPSGVATASCQPGSAVRRSGSVTGWGASSGTRYRCRSRTPSRVAVKSTSLRASTTATTPVTTHGPAVRLPLQRTVGVAQLEVPVTGGLGRAEEAAVGAGRAVWSSRFSHGDADSTHSSVHEASVPTRSQRRLRCTRGSTATSPRRRGARRPGRGSRPGPWGAHGPGRWRSVTQPRDTEADGRIRAARERVPMTLDARRIRCEVLDDERRHPALVDVGVRDCPAVATPPEPAIAPELLRRLVLGEAVRDAILGICRHAAHVAERSRGAEWRGVQVAIADPREL